MWGFNTLKDSIHTHAAELFRSVSDRIAGDCHQESPQHDEPNSVCRDAMKNVVTPKSIPKFTLPPLLTYDSPPASPVDDPLYLNGSDIAIRGSTMTLTDRDRPMRSTGSNDPVQAINATPSLTGPKRTCTNFKKGNGGGKMNGSTSFSVDSSHFTPLTSLDGKSHGKDADSETWDAKDERENEDERQRLAQPHLGFQHLVFSKDGFSVLSESPNTRRKESLFHGDTCGNWDSRRKMIDRTRSSSNYAKASSRQRYGTKSMKHREKSLERGYRSADLSYNTTDHENSDSDGSVASYHNDGSHSPIISRIRSHRLLKRCELAVACRNSPESDAHSLLTYTKQQGSPRNVSKSCSKYRGRHISRLGICSLENADDQSPSEEHSNNTLCPSSSEGQLFSNTSRHNRLCSSAHNVSTTRQGKSTPSDTQPSVRVCLTYLPKHRRLNISLLEGKDFIPGLTVYLKVTLLPRHERSHRTDPIKVQTPTPFIRERLTFESIREEDIPHMSLKICCKEKSSRIRHAGLIGQSILAFCNIDFKQPTDMWASLKSFYDEEAPHIQLSLCYDAMLGCLTVDVVAARNLPKGSLARQPDSFVTLTEILPNKNIAKKQTKVVHRTQDPVFQESFLFSLCTDAQTPDELVIVATLSAKDRVRGTVATLGSAKLGQLVDSWSGRSQWAQALANEGEPVTCWHTLEGNVYEKR